MPDNPKEYIVTLFLPCLASLAIGFAVGALGVTLEVNSRWTSKAEKDCYPFALAYASVKDFDSICAGP